MESTENTYTADQIIDIGGSHWARGNKNRVYLNDWPDLVGLEYARYGTGNVRSAGIDGEGISNRTATTLLGAKVFWENGRIVTDLDRVADSVRLDGADLLARLHAGIAAKVNREQPPETETFTVRLSETPQSYFVQDPNGCEGDLMEVEETRASIVDSDGYEVDAFAGPVSEDWLETQWDTALCQAGYGRIEAWDHGGICATVVPLTRALRELVPDVMALADMTEEDAAVWLTTNAAGGDMLPPGSRFWLDAKVSDADAASLLEVAAMGSETSDGPQSED